MRLRIERTQNDGRSCVSISIKKDLRAPARADAKSRSSEIRGALKSKIAALI
jgi:hypothetical protein